MSRHSKEQQRNIFKKAWRCVIECRRPYALRWMDHANAAMFISPLTFVKAVIGFMRGNISEDAFRLKVYSILILRKCAAACQKVGLKPFLVFGSLLGFYREGGVIDTDNDIDLGILEENSALIPALKNEMTKAGFGIRKQTPTMISFIHKDYFNYFIDIWTCKRAEGDRVVYLSTPSIVDAGFYAIHPYPADMFAAFKTVKFIGTKILAPSRMEDFLRQTYGKDWRTPTPPMRNFADKVRQIYPNRQLMPCEDYERGDIHITLAKKEL